MKVLVTGSGGFLGVAVVERLLAHGYQDLRCMLRDPSKKQKLLRLAEKYPQAKIEFVTGNLTSRQDNCAAAAGVQSVIHVAAAMKGSAANMILDTVVGSRNLLDAIAQIRPMRIVLVSSFGVYGVSNLRRGAVVNEDTPLEPHPEWRDIYSFSKLWQEQLFREYEKQYGFELVVLRAGVIYGPGGGHFSSRVGLNMFGLFLHLGGRNLLPLSYVENAAEAVVVAGLNSESAGQTYNVHDDDLPSSAQYLRRYKREVRKLRSLRIPYFALQWMSRATAWYHEYSKGQLPAIFTPYKSAAQWAGNHFDNTRLKSTGWKQLVSTRDGLARTFQSFRAQLNA